MNRKKILTSLFTLITMLLLIAVTPVLADTEPLEDPIPEPIETGQVRIRLETVATEMTAPNWGTAVPGCESLSGRLVVTDQDGILWAVNLATGQKSVLLDVGDRLVALGAFGPGTFDERGLLGVAFHPDFAGNGLLYTYTSEPVDGPADFSTMPMGVAPNHQSVISEWQIPDPCDASSVVDPESRRELLRIDQPQFNHDAGALVFGPDGELYISLGDGGAADDQGVGHVEGGNGQDPSNILGTILRIDPDGNNSANGQYGIPADNPFVSQPDALDEIFAYGLRNPFRFSFDSRTGEMYIADVGQNDIEEISLGVSGGNFGWRIKEGSFCFDPNGTDPGFVFECGPGDAPEGLIDPIAEYDHDEGIAVVGGFVYRGSEIPPLKGRYVFGDFLQPAIDSGRLFYLQKNDRILEFQLVDQDTLGLRLLGFGQDASGELYVLANATGTPFGDTGVVLRITSGQPGARNFGAHLSGDEEVPPVDTQAQGQATFKVSEDESEMSFKLNVANIEDVVAAHIHCAPAGVNGPVGVTLFSGGPVSPDGTLAEGTITSPDPGNGCGWTSLEAVLSAISSGNAYVNVHTLANPAGEIRGQIQ
ncbi:MAG TPA: PQQ-dependent sugar dehydrogenase [Anaerolineales bacterium]